MPELPEVEVVARQLDQKLKGKRIKQVEVLRAKSFNGEPKLLVGQKVSAVDRVAKMIEVEFESWDKLVMIHLKMTGQLVWRPKNWNQKHLKREVAGGHPTSDWVGDLPSKHTRVIWRFTDGSQLFFNDQRVFGWMKIVERSDWEKLTGKLPPDVTDKEFSLNYFKEILKKSSRGVKLVVTDQAKLGGVGNIYVNDALWLAKIHPKRAAKSLTEAEVGRLYRAVKGVIKKGIKYGGATYSDFRNIQGLGGKYQEHFLAYDREGEKCRRCGEKIKKIRVGGRGTYFCPTCQK